MEAEKCNSAAVFCTVLHCFLQDFSQPFLGALHRCSTPFFHTVLHSVFPHILHSSALFLHNSATFSCIFCKAPHCFSSPHVPVNIAVLYLNFMVQQVQQGCQFILHGAYQTVRSFAKTVGKNRAELPGKMMWSSIQQCGAP